MASQLAFDAATEVERAESDAAFVVDLDGFEGPVDLLLELARQQKVDLQRISILALADQYLGFIENMRRLRLELAADYLVMAAWLAYLKSRLLLPDASPEEPPAAELAAEFARRLQRLELIREAARRLMDRPQLGRDFHGRGAPEGIDCIRSVRWQASLYDLLSAYARQRHKHALSRVTLAKRTVWSLEQGREMLHRLIGRAAEWTALDSHLVAHLHPPAARRTALASTFAAALELAREGDLDIRQERTFAPIWVRARLRSTEPPSSGAGDGKDG